MMWTYFTLLYDCTYRRWSTVTFIVYDIIRQYANQDIQTKYLTLTTTSVRTYSLFTHPRTRANTVDKFAKSTTKSLRSLDTLITLALESRSYTTLRAFWTLKDCWHSEAFMMSLKTPVSLFVTIIHSSAETSEWSVAVVLSWQYIFRAPPVKVWRW